MGAFHPTAEQVAAVLGIVLRHRIKLTHAMLEWVFDQRHVHISRFVEDHLELFASGTEAGAVEEVTETLRTAIEQRNACTAFLLVKMGATLTDDMRRMWIEQGGNAFLFAEIEHEARATEVTASRAVLRQAASSATHAAAAMCILRHAEGCRGG